MPATAHSPDPPVWRNYEVEWVKECAMAKKERADVVSKKAMRKKPKPGVPEGDEESCRCKEVAKKTPKELLKVAIDDLSFWKKTKKS
jgi:hypothetical protein